MQHRNSGRPSTAQTAFFHRLSKAACPVFCEVGYCTT